MKQIGFIGLGHMGNPMVRNLLKAGYTVHVYDVTAEAMQTCVDQGAQASSLTDLATQSDIIFTSVQTGEQVEHICLSKEGIFNHAKPGSLFIDCSSIDIMTTRKLHAHAKQHDIAMVDAPVSGGVAGAEAATLTFMVGGSVDNFNLAEPILKLLGKKIIHAGAEGNGQAAKICNNLLLGISMIGVSEAFVLAEKLGLEAKKFFEISSHASGQCWSMTSYCPVPGIVASAPSNNQYRPGFMAKMMLKDLRLGLQAAETVDSAIPLGSVATELYQIFVEDGYGEIDFSAIINFIRGELD